MKLKFKFRAYVKAINSEGESAFFELEKPAEKKIEPQEKQKDLFLGEKFRGRFNKTTACDFVVVEVRSVKCVPEPFYLSVLKGLEKGCGFIRLGNYDNPDNENLEFRKSPLTGMTVSFELMAGEGLVFNRVDAYGLVADSMFKWTKSDYVVTRWQDEIWTLPKSNWELHLSPDSGVDYEDPDNFRDALPELSSW